MTPKPKISHYTVYMGGEKIKGLPFQGELMTCFICGTQQLSNPKVESNWTCFTNPATGKRLYLCPACWCEENLMRIMLALEPTVAFS